MGMVFHRGCMMAWGTTPFATWAQSARTALGLAGRGLQPPRIHGKKAPLTRTSTSTRFQMASLTAMPGPSWQAVSQARRGGRHRANLRIEISLSIYLLGLQSYA